MEIKVFALLSPESPHLFSTNVLPDVPINLEPQASPVFGAFQLVWKKCHVNILRCWETAPAPSCPTPFGPGEIENFSVHPDPGFNADSGLLPVWTDRAFC